MDIGRRLIHRLEFEWQKRRVQSGRAFCKKVLHSEARILTEGSEVIRLAYTEYTRKVSDPSMAISLELSCVLYGLTRSIRPTRILELGSGFSTFVLARSASTWQATVLSLEDDSDWASKTVDFLARHGIFNALVELIQKQIGQTQYPFVFVDLNLVEVRKDYIEYAYHACMPGGIIVFDDIHKPDFYFEVLNQSRTWNVELYDLKAFTLDTYGRYSLAMIKH